MHFFFRVFGIASSTVRIASSTVFGAEFALYRIRSHSGASNVFCMIWRGNRPSQYIFSKGFSVIFVIDIDPCATHLCRIVLVFPPRFCWIMGPGTGVSLVRIIIVASRWIRVFQSSKTRNGTLAFSGGDDPLLQARGWGPAWDGKISGIAP